MYIAPTCCSTQNYFDQIMKSVFWNEVQSWTVSVILIEYDNILELYNTFLIFQNLK